MIMNLQINVRLVAGSRPATRKLRTKLRTAETGDDSCREENKTKIGFIDKMLRTAKKVGRRIKLAQPKTTESTNQKLPKQKKVREILDSESSDDSTVLLETKDKEYP